SRPVWSRGWVVAACCERSPGYLVRLWSRGRPSCGFGLDEKLCLTDQVRCVSAAGHSTHCTGTTRARRRTCGRPPGESGCDLPQVLNSPRADGGISERHITRGVRE